MNEEKKKSRAKTERERWREIREERDLKKNYQEKAKLGNKIKVKNERTRKRDENNNRIGKLMQKKK